MKKLVPFIFLLIMLQHPAFAETVPGFGTYRELPTGFGINHSFFTVDEGMLAMSDDTRAGVTRYGRIPAWVATGINLFIGIGLGSFIQGDTFGGTVGLVADAAALGLTILGARLNNFALGVGIPLSLVSRLFQIIRPWYYDFSGRLTLAATVDPHGRMSFGPSFTYTF